VSPTRGHRGAPQVPDERKTVHDGEDRLHRHLEDHRHREQERGRGPSSLRW